MIDTTRYMVLDLSHGALRKPFELGDVVAISSAIILGDKTTGGDIDQVGTGIQTRTLHFLVSHSGKPFVDISLSRVKCKLITSSAARC